MDIPKFSCCCIPVAYLDIIRCPIVANVQKDKFIVCISNSDYNDGIELFVVVKIRTSTVWLLDSNMFSINSPKNMVKIPYLMEGLCNVTPLNLCIGCHYEFVPKFFNNRFADLLDHFRYGVWCYPKASLEVGKHAAQSKIP